MLDLIGFFLLLYGFFVVLFFDFRYLLLYTPKYRIPRGKKLERRINLSLIIPVKNENENILIKKIEYVKKIKRNFPNLNIIYLFLDDTDINKEKNLIDHLEKNKIDKLNEKNFLIYKLDENFYYIFRFGGIKRKGAALDDILKYLREKFNIEYFSVYDLEWTITPKYIYESVKILETYKEYSYVFYNRVSKSVSFFHKLANIYADNFFQLILPTKSYYDNLSLITGSCGVIRYKDYEEVGGFTPHITEDALLTVKLLLRGKKGIYIKDWKEYGQNLAPNFNMTTKTLRRWQIGSFDVIISNLGKILGSKKLSLTQKLSLIHTYTSLFSPILVTFPLIIISTIYVIYQIPSEVYWYFYPMYWIITFFIIITYTIEYYITSREIGEKSIKLAFLTLIFSWAYSALTIYYYIKRLVLGYEDKWIVTVKLKRRRKIDIITNLILIIFLTLIIYITYLTIKGWIIYLHYHYNTSSIIFVLLNLTIGLLSNYIWIVGLSMLLIFSILHTLRSFDEDVKDLLYIGIK